MAHQGGRKEQLGPHEGHRREGAAGARRRRRGRREHVCIPGVVQRVFRLHSAVGARRRRRKAARALEGQAHARSHPERHGERGGELGQRVAGNPRPAGRADLGRPERGAATAAGEDARRRRDIVERGSDRRAVRPADQGPRVHGGRRLRDVRAGHRAEDAIRKFSALPASRMRFTDRGVLKPGLRADVVVFDPEQIKDLATFENPNQLSSGMEYVLVNGVPVIAGGKMTDALPGQILRGPGYRRTRGN
ncbi:MAG: hypothetical protein DMG04_25220 [Acidobacteria bacterium]|nr:MAG: hypothetical protein DMG04_25220 [Acidobacteriota bacterium]